LQAALKGASAVTPQTLLAGADRQGNSFPLASGYASAFLGDPDHYDGATATRVLSWDVKANGWVCVSHPSRCQQDEAGKPC